MAADPQPATGSNDHLLGRAADVDHVVGLLMAGTRVVTVTGRGGVGKTALAAAVADRLEHDGIEVVRVGLQGASDPALVLDEIALAAGIASPRLETLEALARHVADDRFAILVDNFEHLLPAAEQLALLLDRAPTVQLLVTSQARLRLRQEVVVDLQPLAVPAADDQDLEALAANPSVALYVQRAAAVDRRFRLGLHNMAAVAQLCRLLEGLPLAIELAAARATTLPADVILERLAARPLDVLTGGPVDAPSRHRDLRSAIGWTVSLLSPTERSLLQRLSVVAGSFGLDVAEALAEDRASAVDALASLVDFHLVDPGPAPASFVLPPPIRAFAAEELTATGTREQVQLEHVRARLRWAEEARARSEWSDAGDCVALAEPWHDDLVQVLTAAVELGATDEAMRLVLFLVPWLEATGFHAAQRRMVEGVIELASSDPVADPGNLARVMAWCAVLEIEERFGDEVIEALERLERAEALARDTDVETLLEVLSARMVAAPYLRDWTGVVRAAQEGLEVATSTGDRMRQGAFEVWNGMLAHAAGDDERAVTLGLHGLANGRATRNRRTILTAVLLLRPLAANHRPWLADRIPSTVETIELARAAGERMIGDALVAAAAEEALRSQDVPAACHWLLEGLRAARTSVSGIDQVMLFVAVLLFEAVGDHRRAAWVGEVLTPSEAQLFRTLPRESLPRYVSCLGRAREALPARDLAEVRQEAVGVSPLDALGPVEAAVRAHLVGQRPPPTPSFVPPADAPHLTPRQREVLQLLAEGLTNREIATRLGMTPKTVAHHLAAIYLALGVRGRSEAVAWAYRTGFVG